MEIDIRHLEKVKEGIMMYALIPNIERPLSPHYNHSEFDAKAKEMKTIRLGKAKLGQ